MRARIRPSCYLGPDQAVFAVARPSGGTSILRHQADWHRRSNHRTPVRHVSGDLRDRDLADEALRDADVVRVRDLRAYQPAALRHEAFQPER